MGKPPTYVAWDSSYFQVCATALARVASVTTLGASAVFWTHDGGVLKTFPTVLAAVLRTI